MPLVREGSRIVTVMAEPQNIHTIDVLKFLTGMDISPRLGFRSEIMAAIESCYGGPSADSKVESLPFIDQVDASDLQIFTAGTSDKNKAAVEEFEAEMRNERTPAVRLVSAIVFAAAIKRASD